MKSPLSLVAIRFGFMGAFAGASLGSAWAIPPGGFPNDLRGDVNGDGAVTSADVLLIHHYILSSGRLAPLKREPPRRYGYAAGVEIRNAIGNDVVNGEATDLDQSSVVQDRYNFTGLNGLFGDSLFHLQYITNDASQCKGFTATISSRG